MGRGRIEVGGIAHCAGIIDEDLVSRDSGLYVLHIKGLGDLAAAALASRSMNTADWIPLLPRETGKAKSRERYISRLLSNKRIDPFVVMTSFVREVVSKASMGGQTVIMMLDQSKIRDGFECLMLSLAIGERAVPIAWRVIETEGEIGFGVQEELLNKVVAVIPKAVSVLLSADRFYGTQALIGWCKKSKWQYRIRLKGNLILSHEGGEISTGEVAKRGLDTLQDAILGKVKTHIGILHEKEHPEPWIIAMDCKPSKWRVLDYGMRWGIEAMFSDMKSRGFAITKTQLRHSDRIERLILILAIATYWAVSAGIAVATKSSSDIKERSNVSFFKQGLRFILTAIITLAPIPKLWETVTYVGW
jgi:hypothetical protein